MPLSMGEKLGPYEILSAIGAGGMGEVYKARDTRLSRMVAIKVLPEHLASNAEARQRFEREAQAVSSLNHPHICTLYDVGRQDGSDYLVMEYLEGETLAARLRKGPLPAPQALEYGVQITMALAEAHKQDVFHRDLKPGNIMLTKTGAKLLDFGLAKLARAEAAPGADQPTVSADLTAKGTLLGTLPYMAPEQLEGKEADARSDIFAFGAVIYEMLAGRRAFEGKSQASVMAAILEHDPPPISTLQPLTPPALDRVTKTCLAKDPDDRWQTARDLKRELGWIAGAPESGSPAPASFTAASRYVSLPWIAAAVALIALAIPAARHLRETPPPETRVDIVTPATDSPASFALSPDGRKIVFGAWGDGASRLWLRSLATTAAQPLAGTEGATVPFWSPDSRSIGFFAGNALKRLDLGGGAPQTLAPAVAGRGGTWNADGVIVFAPSLSTPLMRVPATGGTAVAVTTLGPQQRGHHAPFFLPDGRRLLFYMPGAPSGWMGRRPRSRASRLRWPRACPLISRSPGAPSRPRRPGWWPTGRAGAASGN
ncbi:MAG: serine/threonine-protein kinase [Acidobacteria bacterium]|nr:serine/threonine-protein kinase [Acidobacteriota bacterium]